MQVLGITRKGAASIGSRVEVRSGLATAVRTGSMGPEGLGWQRKLVESSGTSWQQWTGTARHRKPGNGQGGQQRLGQVR